MTGEQLHYRRVNTRLHVRESGGARRLHATVLRWDQLVQLSAGRGQEWFSRSEPPLKAAVLSITHGGPRAGQVVRWASSILGLDALLVADSSEVGDGLLDLLDEIVVGFAAMCQRGRRADDSFERTR